MNYDIIIFCKQFGRWSLLSLGIVYGAFHQSRLSKIETARREIEEQERPAREARLREEKKRAAAGTFCIYAYIYILIDTF